MIHTKVSPLLVAMVARAFRSGSVPPVPSSSSHPAWDRFHEGSKAYASLLSNGDADLGSADSPGEWLSARRRLNESVDRAVSSPMVLSVLDGSPFQGVHPIIPVQDVARHVQGAQSHPFAFTVGGRRAVGFRPSALSGVESCPDVGFDPAVDLWMDLSERSDLFLSLPFLSGAIRGTGCGVWWRPSVSPLPLSLGEWPAVSEMLLQSMVNESWESWVYPWSDLALARIFMLLSGDRIPLVHVDRASRRMKLLKKELSLVFSGDFDRLCMGIASRLADPSRIAVQPP